jgi:glutamate formiminotransferase/formiminotetrahydrofolate cyclodeaminase
MNPIIECVPNFSEGKNLLVLEKIANSIRKVEGVMLLHISRGEAVHRTVFTFAGEPEKVIEAAFQAIKTAKENIDMRLHKGTHPRFGATDVCPIVPVNDVTIEEAKQYAQLLAKRVGNELQFPVFLYEYSASSPERKKLEYHRSGEYEGLEEKLKLPQHQPDEGLPTFVPETGATVIGARDFLVAYNVNLDTKDLSIAKKIASIIRESGKKKGNNEKGLCKGVKAIGWYIKDFDKVQVSMNLTDLKATPMYEAFEKVKEQANILGAKVTGSELIGLVPLKEMVLAGKYFAQKYEHIELEDETSCVQKAIEYFGLNDVEKFNPKERILEYALNLV